MNSTDKRHWTLIQHYLLPVKGQSEESARKVYERALQDARSMERGRILDVALKHFHARAMTEREYEVVCGVVLIDYEAPSPLEVDDKLRTWADEAIQEYLKNAG